MTTLNALFENRRPWQETAELMISFACGALLTYVLVVNAL